MFEWLGFVTTRNADLRLLVVIERRRLFSAAVYSSVVVRRHVLFTYAEDAAAGQTARILDSRWKHTSQPRSRFYRRTRAGDAWYAFLGCLVGTLVGVLPGISPLAGISILLPVTFGP